MTGSTGPDLVVVGSANVDVVVPVVRRPGPGETVLGGDTITGPGGKGANTAVAAARLGARVAMLGAVGSDAHGDFLLDSLRGSGVDTALVRRVDHPTGAAYITLTPDGENAIVVSPGANAQVSVAHVEEAHHLLTSADVLFTVLEVPFDTVRAAVVRADEAGVRVVLNASPVRSLDADVLTALDPLIVNQYEAAWLLGDAWADPGKADPVAMATSLRERGPRSVVVTLGEDGAVVADASGAVRVTAPRVTPVDTTGAGDAFAGSLSRALARGAGLVDAAEFAATVAAISVTRPGAQTSYPRADELPAQQHPQ